MKNLKNLFSVFIILCILIFNRIKLYSESYYYYNNFSSPLGSEWATNYEYGMEGYLVTGGNSTILAGTGELVVTNAPYTNCCAYNGTWNGNTVHLTNHYTASEYKPFGFDMYRNESRIDGDTTQGVNSATRSENQLDIWLVSGASIPSSDYEAFDNYFLFFERGTRGNANEPYDFYNNPINRSRTGVFSDGLFFLDLSKARDRFGNTVILSNTNCLNFKYNWEGDVDSGGTGDFLGPNQANTNDYIFRITHDGEYVRLYVNPDPDDNDSLPNEFLFLTNKKVFWSSNLSILIGHEVKNDHMVSQSAKYDYILIKSTAERSGFNIKNTLWSEDLRYCSLEIDITNKIGKKDSGINTIYLSSSENNLIFKRALKGIKGDGFHSKLSVRINGNDIPFDAYISKNELKIVLMKFYKKDPIFQLSIPCELQNNSRIFGKEADNIRIYVEGVQYERYRYTWGNGATCGKQRSRGIGDIYFPNKGGVVSCR